MPRQPSLRSQLNQIRSWVRQGRTNAWIAHQLDITIDQLERFKRDHDLGGPEQLAAPPADPLSVPPPEPAAVSDADEEEVEEEVEEEERPEAGETETAPSPRRDSRRGSRGGRGRSTRGERPGRERKERESERAERSKQTTDRESGKPRRRGRRGGRGRSKIPSYEATFDHGEEGYGLWLDPAVVDNPVYSKHWAGHRPVVVRIDADSITIRREGEKPRRDGGQ
ncbi:MAG: hypothetical protein WDZ37_01140 [Solirubrobacterales bacterium]